MSEAGVRVLPGDDLRKAIRLIEKRYRSCFERASNATFGEVSLERKASWALS